jgi:membrane protein YqaA with SNARE-associated domain
MHFLFSFGLFGLFLVSIVDSSFVPLPIPGITDVMLVILAARHSNWLVLILIATLGSALGGYLSYHAGQSGGIAFLEKRIPPRIFNLVRDWMERHAILAVAIPAILPPPMPLTPFVLAVGALKMAKKKFMTTFTISRAARHSIAVGLGVHYGRHILRLWDRISARYATPILIVLWTAILLSCAIAFWKLYKTSHAVTSHSQGLESGSKTPA